jgi:hypothetical protein
LGGRSPIPPFAEARAFPSPGACRHCRLPGPAQPPPESGPPASREVWPAPSRRCDCIAACLNEPRRSGPLGKARSPAAPAPSLTAPPLAPRFPIDWRSESNHGGPPRARYVGSWSRLPLAPRMVRLSAYRAAAPTHRAAAPAPPRRADPPPLGVWPRGSRRRSARRRAGRPAAEGPAPRPRRGTPAAS